LRELLDAVHGHRIPTGWGDHESMVEYDRRRVIKETLLERIITTCVETADAARLLRAEVAAVGCASPPPQGVGDNDDEANEARYSVELFAAILKRDVPQARRCATHLIAALAELPLLYVPLAKSGQPRVIVETRVRQRYLQDLLKCLPRLGLLVETCRLIETAREMERSNPVGPGAVTEFDELFKIGWKSLVECLVVSSEGWEEEAEDDVGASATRSPLVSCLEQFTESLLKSWLRHSRTLRLSVLERANDRKSWKKLVEFVERYGEDLFSQRFLNLGNLRAILHQGVDNWLTRLQEDARDEVQFRLLDELDAWIPREEAVERLTLVLEAIVENYSEYRDYNSTTTQSDRGELLYSLLDFLRLRAKYDRICWNLKPIVLAHEILVRGDCKRAAQIWRRALRERIKDEADKFQKSLMALQKKYAMQMPSIADRIGERFVRPMIIDRIRALVVPAMVEAPHPSPHPTFRILKYETEFLTREPSGVGFDVPAWLVALEEEVQRARLCTHRREDLEELYNVIAFEKLPFDEVQAQIDDWTSN
jgi:hypothetical protein